jgi:hypothetical protein
MHDIGIYDFVHFIESAAGEASRPFRHLSFEIAALAILLHPPSAAAQALAPPPAEDRSRAVECLTLAVAYEAGYEVPEGQQAVAEVVLNRTRNPAFPKSVCDVVFAGSTRKTGCQFSFTCDGSLRRRMPERILAQARSVAEQALDGKLPPLVNDATHYHADYVYPYWAPGLARITKIGTHIFYRRASPGAPVGAQWAASPTTPAPGGAPSRPAFAPWGLLLPAGETPAPAGP